MLYTSLASRPFQREIKLSKMFALVFLLFSFGYMPYGIIRMIDSRNSLHPDVYVGLTLIFVITTTVSPFVVIEMNTQIRVQCVKLLKSVFTDSHKKAKKANYFEQSQSLRYTPNRLSAKSLHLKHLQQSRFSAIKRNLSQNDLDVSMVPPHHSSHASSLYNSSSQLRKSKSVPLLEHEV